MRVNAYVDGFNLYYRRLQGTPYKWLDLRRMLELLLPEANLLTIRYFTARLVSPPDDPGQGRRQQTYIDALETIQGLTIHYGTFKRRVKERMLASPPHDVVEVIEMEEKGSDVNLATYLLLDGFKNSYDSAIVVSNDSDLRQPIHVARHRLGKKVGVVIPGTEKAIRTSALAADFYRRLRKGVLRASQLPDPLPRVGRGEVRKPPNW